MLVVADDEGPDGRPEILDPPEGAAVDHLLLQGPDEPFRHAVGLGLLDEGEARGDLPEPHLVDEVIRQVLRPMIQTQGASPPGGIGPGWQSPCAFTHRFPVKPIPFAAMVKGEGK